MDCRGSTCRRCIRQAYAAQGSTVKVSVGVGEHPPIPAHVDFVGQLRALALAMRDAVLRATRGASIEELSQAVAEQGGDTIYRLDLHAEAPLLEYCERWGAETPFLLIAEGLEGGERRFPQGAATEALTFTLIADPVDGTRGLMYGKRSAWTLLGIAPPPRGDWWPTLAEISVALQAELPTPRAALADVLWAVRGQGAQAETHDLRTGEIVPFAPRPSRASTLLGGFGGLVKFFPGEKVAAAHLEERLFLELLGPPPDETAQVFDDEYISSGGQLYELIVGRDRFVADLRPVLSVAGGRGGLCAHPYDLCTALIAREAGVIVTDAFGAPLAVALDTNSPVTWIGYANETLRRQIAPVLTRLLREAMASA